MKVTSDDPKNVVYFPIPEVVEIGGPLTSSYVKPVIKSNCRLPSSFGVDSNVPECIEYRLHDNSTYNELQTYLTDMEIKGYGEGAVVARRYSRPTRWKYPSQWGVIVLVRKYISSVSKDPFSPFTVKWFDQTEGLEGAHAEDLIIIHPCIDEVYLNDLVEAQGVDTARK